MIPVAGEGGIVSIEVGAPECDSFLAACEAGEAMAVWFFERAMGAAAGVGDGG